MSPMPGSDRLDRIDVKILAALQKDGRMTNALLAEAVSLSESPCLKRVRRLEATGYIKGYSALLDVAKIAEHLTIFAEVTLSDHRREDVIRFERGISRFHEVRECHQVSGGFDYLVRFVCPSIVSYQELIDEVLEANLGVKKYFTYIVLRSPLVRFGAPIMELVEAQGRSLS